MSNVGSIGKPEVTTTVQQDRHPRPASDVKALTRPADSAEISPVSQLLNKLAEVPDVRQGRIDKVRAELDAGTYETPAKLDAAIDNLAPDLI